MQIPPGATYRTILVYAKDILTDLGKTGLVAANITASYIRVETDNDVTITAITEADLTALTDAHSDGGWFPVDATNAPGLYRFDLPDGVFTSGAWEAAITIIDAGSNNFEIAPTRIELDTSDLPRKNTALSNIEFLMVDATDFATPETGLTVSGTRSLDGGAFAAVDGTIAEVANGIYQFDAVAADMNGGIVTFRFAATGAADTFVTIRTQ